MYQLSRISPEAINVFLQWGQVLFRQPSAGWAQRRVLRPLGPPREPDVDSVKHTGDSGGSRQACVAHTIQTPFQQCEHAKDDREAPEDRHGDVAASGPGLLARLDLFLRRHDETQGRQACRPR